MNAFKTANLFRFVNYGIREIFTDGKKTEIVIAYQDYKCFRARYIENDKFNIKVLYKCFKLIV